VGADRGGTQGETKEGKRLKSGTAGKVLLSQGGEKSFLRWNYEGKKNGTQTGAAEERTREKVHRDSPQMLSRGTPWKEGLQWGTLFVLDEVTGPGVDEDMLPGGQSYREG